MKRIIFFGLISILILLYSCRTRNTKSIFYPDLYEVNVESISTCKKSSISQFKNDSTLTGLIKSTTKKTIKEIKIKTKKDSIHSTYKIQQTNFTINENCSSKAIGGKPTIKLTQVITLVNLKTDEEIKFQADTNYLFNQSFVKDTTTKTNKLDFNNYIKNITTKNFKQIKAFLINKP